MKDTFIHEAEIAGIGHEWPYWSTAPEILGDHLLNVAKRAARFIKRASPNLSHSMSLEAVARGAGLRDWHALQSLAQGLIDDFDTDRHWPRPRLSRERMAALTPVFPMLAASHEDCAPTADQERGMRIFAERLCATGYLSSAQALDVVARMNGEDNWVALTQRLPEDSAKPLYRFCVDEDGGRFVPSSACADLVRQQDKLHQGFWSQSDEQQELSYSWVDGITSRRPDFLEGLLAKADILSHPLIDPRGAGRIYAEAIAAADRLMPDGFDGVVSWDFINNRFYHRLLFGYTEWNIVFGSKAKALALVRKQLRLNPADNLGLRYYLPVLLAQAGKLSPALKALARFDRETQADPAPPFIRSLVFAALGRRQDAARELLHSLFVFPALRAVVAVNERDGDRAMSVRQRAITMDLGTSILQFVTLSPKVQWMAADYSTWLNHPSVRSAERSLAALYARSKKPGRWIEQVLAKANEMSELLEPSSAHS